jgi:sirohydrochlorin cobaltochelatase
MTTRTALVLAGHGSHISPHTAGLVWYHVDELRALNIADEVTAAFWKEMPSFHTVFASLEATDITVVPLFTAQGYFTQTVIPAEMGLDGPITHRGGRTIRYTRTLSEHPYLGGVVRQRVEDALDMIQRVKGISPEQVAVAIIGHSTRRNPESRKATEAQAQAIRETGLAGEVVAVYLDDTPSIPDVYSLTHAPHLIAVPYFLAYGSHTLIDVPRALGFEFISEGFGHEYNGTQRDVNGRSVYYTPPVGIGDDLRGAIMELAKETGAPLKVPRARTHWPSFPKVGFNSFQQMLLKGYEMPIGQLKVSPREVRHILDENPTETIDNPFELRRRVRENPFRPLATSDDLPRGWRVPIDYDLNKAYAVVETIYPGAIANMVISHSEVNSLEKVLDRQTGQYRQLSALTTEQQSAVVEQVCGKCVRRPLWTTPVHEMTNLLVCPEPCNYWLTAAVNELDGDKTE